MAHKKSLLYFASYKPQTVWGYLAFLPARVVAIAILAAIALPLYIHMSFGGRGIMAEIFGLSSQGETDQLRREVADLRAQLATQKN